MQILGEAKNEAEDVIGDDIAEYAAHVGDYHRRFDQLREEVFFHAGGGGLCPAQFCSGFEHGRRQGAEESVGIRNFGPRLAFILSLNDRHRRRGLAHFEKAVVGNSGINEQFHLVFSPISPIASAPGR